MMDNRPIGLLDSGVGGLTVVKKVIQKMPNESTVFIGDNAHIPYGDKSSQEIIALTRQSVKFLLSKNVKLIIIACNTATAVAMKTIQKEINVPVIGVIQSGSVAALQATKNKKIAVVGTQMTVALHAYQKELESRDPKVKVIELAAPKLVPLIEQNANSSSYWSIFKKILEPLKENKFDTLILGCTHYPIIRAEFSRCLPQAVKIVNPADQAAQYTKQVLENGGLCSNRQDAGQHEYYTTGDVKKVNELGQAILNDPTFTAEHVLQGAKR